MKAFTFFGKEAMKGVVVTKHPQHKEVVVVGNGNNSKSMSLDTTAMPDVVDGLVYHVRFHGIPVKNSKNKFYVISAPLRGGDDNIVVRINTANNKTGTWRFNSGKPKIWAEGLGRNLNNPYSDDLIEMEPGQSVVVNEKYLVTNKSGEPVVEDYVYAT